MYEGQIVWTNPPLHPELRVALVRVTDQPDLEHQDNANPAMDALLSQIGGWLPGLEETEAALRSDFETSSLFQHD